MENPAIDAEKREEAAKTLREILDRMGIEAEVSAFDDGDRIILDAHGAESGLIIGKKGATLDALQYVINRIISKKTNDGPGVIVDADSYRGQRGVARRARGRPGPPRASAGAAGARAGCEGDKARPAGPGRADEPARPTHRAR